jgi:hypothetical protein
MLFLFAPVFLTRCYVKNNARNQNLRLKCILKDNVMRKLILLISHGAMLVIGFVLGIYALPILIAPASVDRAALTSSAENALYSAEFVQDLKGSDFLHWGTGTVSVSQSKIVHIGELVPGPDYKLYLVPKFVNDADGFNAIKAQSKRLGDVKTFDGVIVDVPADVNIEDYNTVLIWCETFGAFITSAKYR